MLAAEPKAWFAAAKTIPSLTVVPPVNVLTPESSSVPGKVFVTATAEPALIAADTFRPTAAYESGTLKASDVTALGSARLPPIVAAGADVLLAPLAKISGVALRFSFPSAPVFKLAAVLPPMPMTRLLALVVLMGSMPPT